MRKMRVHSKYGMYIPMNIMSERQAKRNHMQTLERLNERGGVTWVEAAYIIEEKRFDMCNPMSDDEALIIIFNAMMALLDVQGEK